MSILNLYARLGLVDVDLSIGLIDIDLDLAILPATDNDDVVAGSTGTDVIETLLGDDIIIGSDGLDVIDGSLGFDTLLFDFSSDRHVNSGVGRDVTVTNTSFATSELLTPDVLSTILGINRVVIRFGEFTGGAVVDLFDDTVNAALFTGIGGIQIESGGGTDDFIGTLNDDVFSFLMGAGTGTMGSADGNGGNDVGLVRLEVGASDTISYAEAGDVVTIGNGAGEQVELTDIDEIAFSASGLVPGGSGGTITINAGDATRTVLVEFTDDGNVTDYDADMVVTTGSGDDIIVTNAGDDIIDGGAGADQMAGGNGDDIYYFDNAGDTVTELPGGGNDRVYFSLDWNIFPVPFANVESFGLVGDARELIGDGRDNILLANDTKNSRLFGRGGDDTLIGGAMNDRLYGEAGNDEMRGGLGDDFYRVEDAGDTVIELVGEGTDKVLSKINYVLAANVENLKLTSTATEGTGNELDNIIEAGNLGAILMGMGGNDKLRGSNNDDHLEGNDGDDNIRALRGDDTLLGGAGNDDLFGDGGADLLEGGTGNDRLRGGEDNDTLHGGTGNDELRGDNGDDVMFGDEGTDRMFGGAGNDQLTGGAGRDVMFGGSGADIFFFNEGDMAGLRHNTADEIKDFSQGAGDIIDLSGLDAIAGAGDDAFTFIGDAAFSGTAGELRWEHEANLTMVYMDIDGDMNADYAIRLDGTINLAEADFIL